jgi:hypothetical protein
LAETGTTPTPPLWYRDGFLYVEQAVLDGMVLASARVYARQTPNGDEPLVEVRFSTSWPVDDFWGYQDCYDIARAELAKIIPERDRLTFT